MRLIDADDLLEIIEKYCGDYDCHDSESFDKQAVRMAIRSAPTITPQNEWISVGDAVPDPGDRVMATDGIFVGEAYRTSADSWYRHTGFPWRLACGKIVTHWMPLPEPPEKENDGR